MSQVFPKKFRLCTRRDFLRIRYVHNQFVGGQVIVDIRKNGLTHSRLGITVTKKYGKAYLRNQFKRIVREAFRLCQQQIPQGFDIHVRPKGRGEISFHKIQDELLKGTTNHA